MYPPGEDLDRQADEARALLVALDHSKATHRAAINDLAALREQLEATLHCLRTTLEDGAIVLGRANALVEVAGEVLHESAKMFQNYDGYLAAVSAAELNFRAQAVELRRAGETRA